MQTIERILQLQEEQGGLMKVKKVIDTSSLQRSGKKEIHNNASSQQNSSEQSENSDASDTESSEIAEHAATIDNLITPSDSYQQTIQELSIDLNQPPVSGS